MENFETASLSVKEVADALSCDVQTVRVMIQQGIVSWGKAFKMPGSSKYRYLISPVKFYEETGWRKH